MTAVDYFPRTAAERTVATPLEATAPLTGGNEPLLGGTIHVRQNRATAVMATIFSAIAVTSVAALWLGHLAKSETVRGIVSTVTGSSRLEAPRGGVIKDIFAKQGDHVKAGSRIAVLRLAATSSGGQATDATEARLLAQKRANYEADAKRSAAVIEQTRTEEATTAVEQITLSQAFDAQERTIRAGVALETASVKKLTGLLQSGYATNDMLDQHRRALFEYERSLADVRLRRIDARQQNGNRLRQLHTVINERTTAAADAENLIADADLRMAQLNANESLDIIAQTDGNVLTIAGKPGDSVTAGQLVAAIGDPTAEPVIVLDAPSSTMGLAKLGQRVVLKYDAFPFKTFGVAYGTITSISASAIRMAVPDKDKSAGETLDPRGLEKQSLYRIEVKPERRTIRAYGAEQSIAIGTTLTADIVIERRRLIDWVLDPIRAMAGRT